MSPSNSIYIYLEGSYDRVSSLIKLARKNRYRCFTQDSIYQKFCEIDGVECVLVLRGRHFRNKIKKLHPGVIILRNDSLVGENYWLAREYKTVVVEEAFQFRLIEDIQNLATILYENNGLAEKLCLPILKILSLAPVHPRLKSFSPYDVISRSFLTALFNRFYLGMKNKSMFPGMFSYKYCVSHAQNKEALIYFGFDESKLEVTGLPIFDSIPGLIRDWKDRGQVIKHDLLYISQPWSQYAGFANFYDLLFPKLMSLAKNYSLCVKLHPRERIQDFKYFEDCPDIHIIPHSPTFSLEDNLRLILESKYIIGTGSGLMNLAILLDKPVIIHNLLFPDIQTPYEMMGLTFCTDSFEGVMRAIQDCEKSTERYCDQMKAQQNIKSRVVLDGKVFERIDKVVEEVTNIGRKEMAMLSVAMN